MFLKQSIHIIQIKNKYFKHKIIVLYILERTCYWQIVTVFNILLL
jgi:hypothetical protein